MKLIFKGKKSEKPKINLLCGEAYEVFDDNKRRVIIVGAEEIIYLNPCGSITWSSVNNFNGIVIRNITDKLKIEVEK